jgi:hypothetical protein
MISKEVAHQRITNAIAQASGLNKVTLKYFLWLNDSYGSPYVKIVDNPMKAYNQAMQDTPSHSFCHILYSDSIEVIQELEDGTRDLPKLT